MYDIRDFTKLVHSVHERRWLDCSHLNVEEAEVDQIESESLFVFFERSEVTDRADNPQFIISNWYVYLEVSKGCYKLELAFFWDEECVH